MFGRALEEDARAELGHGVDVCESRNDCLEIIGSVP